MICIVGTLDVLVRKMIHFVSFPITHSSKNPRFGAQRNTFWDRRHVKTYRLDMGFMAEMSKFLGWAKRQKQPKTEKWEPIFRNFRFREKPCNFTNFKRTQKRFYFISQKLSFAVLNFQRETTKLPHKLTCPVTKLL